MNNSTAGWTASPSVASGPRRQTSSSARPNEVRLVVTTPTPGPRTRMASTMEATSSRRCSQLSKINRATRVLRWSSNVDRAASPATGQPTASATATSMAEGSEITDRSMNHTPSGHSSASRSPNSVTSRVLPTPPGPTIETRRPDPVSSAMPLTSSSRPIRRVRGRTRLWPSAGRARNATLELAHAVGHHVEQLHRLVEVPQAKVTGRQQRHPGDGAGEGGRVLGHHDLSTVGGGNDSGSLVHGEGHVVAVAGVGQPGVDTHANPHRHHPAATRSDCRDRCASAHAATAAPASAKATKKASPSVLTSRPPWSSQAARSSCVVPLQQRRVGVAQPPEQTRRSLDVGEHEGHHAAGQLGHAARNYQRRAAREVCRTVW